MDKRGYFLIDGSHLFSSIFAIRRKRQKFKNRKLNISVLSRVLMNKWAFDVEPAVRATFYFKKGDSRLKTMLKIPKTNKPGEKNYWQIEECAEGLKAIPEKYLQKLPKKYRDQYKREKGLDVKLACDALILISSGKAQNIVFLVDDRDYIPLFRAVQYLGANVYLTSLSGTPNIQEKLTDCCDRYLTLDDELDSIFGITKKESKQRQQIIPQEKLTNGLT